MQKKAAPVGVCYGSTFVRATGIKYPDITGNCYYPLTDGRKTNPWKHSEAAMYLCCGKPDTSESTSCSINGPVTSFEKIVT